MVTLSHTLSQATSPYDETVSNPDALRALVTGIIREQTVQMHEHVVSTVNGDGTVTLGYDEASITNVSCSSSYPVRAIGDKVIVAKIGAGSWYVLAKAESTGSDGTVTLKDLYEAIDNVHTQILNEIPASIALQFGSGGVPSGFDTASSIGIRDDGTGNFTLYLGGVGGSPSARPSASSTPTARTINPTGYGSWGSDGSVDPARVLQGSAGQQWLGAWFYGNAIPLACQGKTVKSMSLTLTRTNEGSTAPVRAYLHDGTVATSQPTLIDGPLTPFSLAKNESRVWAIPAAWRTRLADPGDPSRGIAVQSGTNAEFMAFATSSGTLSITFSAS